MPTLTETAKVAKKIIKYSSISIIALIILIPLVRASIRYWDELHPDPPPPPNAAFGKLPAIKFGESTQAIPTDLQFQLQTVEGTLPNLSNQTKVYFIPTLGSKFFDEEKTRQKANLLGFPLESQQINPTKFLFINPQTKATLQIDTINNNFEIHFPYQEDQSFANFPAPNQIQALNELKSLLARSQMWPNDIDETKTQSTFLKYQPAENKLITVPSLSEAQLIQINLFRTDQNGLPILPPHPNETNISFIISQNSELGKKIIKGHYVHYPINYDHWATYPLKSPNVAWEELKTGKAYVTILGNNSNQKPIIIRKIYLAYFDPDIAQSFLQPIFVFEGDNQFLAYLSAIDSIWVKE